MFDWLTEIDKPSVKLNHEDGDIKIEKLESQIELNEMSEVCQLFASFAVILERENTLTSLPTPNDKALHTIISEVVPHYLDVKKIYFDGKLKQINVKNLKKESSKIVKNLLSKGIYPVIPDLYRSKEYKLPSYPRVIKFYSINLESIRHLHMKETDRIQEFFRNSFFPTDGLIVLQPTGWFLDEKLKESITIRTFSTFAKQIVLVVNDNDKSVIGLEVLG